MTDCSSPDPETRKYEIREAPIRGYVFIAMADDPLPMMASSPSIIKRTEAEAWLPCLQRAYDIGVADQRAWSNSLHDLPED